MYILHRRDRKDSLPILGGLGEILPLGGSFLSFRPTGPQGFLVKIYTHAGKAKALLTIFKSDIGQNVFKFKYSETLK